MICRAAFARIKLLSKIKCPEDLDQRTGGPLPIKAENPESTDQSSWGESRGRFVAGITLNHRGIALVIAESGQVRGALNFAQRISGAQG